MRCKACNRPLADNAPIDDDLCTVCFSEAFKEDNILDKDYTQGHLETDITKYLFIEKIDK